MEAFYWFKDDGLGVRLELKWQNGVLIDREHLPARPFREAVTLAMVAIRNRRLNARG